MKTLEVLFTPADFAALQQRNLADTLCVVFDVFRATSSMVTALANGAVAVIPVGDIAEALAVRQRDPDVLLAGERDGLRIGAALTGGIEFDLGNSPHEFTREKVGGKTIASTTTNGTRALQAAAQANAVLIGSFLNLQATADFVRRENPVSLVIVCSGTADQAAYEDVLGAGALCELLADDCAQAKVADSARMAHQLFLLGKNDLLKTASESRNGRRLLANADLRADVAFCLQRDICNFTAALQSDGKVRIVT